MIMRFPRTFISRLTVGLALVFVLPAMAQTAALPDVVGIRPGMSAQEAYQALSERAKGSKIGIAQGTIDGIDKPVVVLMALQVVGSSPREEIVVYLTYPPEKQIVWAVRRTLTFEPGKEPTKADVMDGLRQKYGPELPVSAWAYWSFGEDARRSNMREVASYNCGGRATMYGVDNFVTPQPNSPLPYLQPLPNCESYVSVRAQVENGSLVNNALASTVTVIVEDTPAALRSRTAWKALASGQNAAARQQEIDKAKQQQKPTF